MMKINITGIDTVNRYMVELPKKLDFALTQASENFIDLTVIDAKNRAPISAGGLMQSIRKEPVRKGKNVKVWKIVADSPDAYFQEVGFAPHFINAGMENRMGIKLSDLGFVGKAWVSHNKPFMAPAVERQLSRLSQELNIAVGRATK
jgi:hypothetical protein